MVICLSTVCRSKTLTLCSGASAPSSVPRLIEGRVSGPGIRTEVAPNLAAVRSIAPPAVRSFSPLKSSAFSTFFETVRTL